MYLNLNPVLPSLIVLSGLEVPQLVLVDVGCSGGIEPVWNPIGPALRAYGIDPLVSEVERLNREDKRPGISYFDGFVTGPSPSRRRTGGWFERGSSAVAHAKLRINHTEAVFNRGATVVMSENKFTLDEFMGTNALERVDFIKTDTDGSDHSVVAGGEKMFKSALGALVEASLAGANNAFGDVEALMSDRGFYVASLRIAKYTRAALPGRFCSKILANTETGGASWGDFLFLRDVVKDTTLDMETALRFAMICESFGVPDIGAEALVAIREHAPGQITMLLDGLVRYSAFPEASSYDAMIAKFHGDPRAFVANQNT